MTIAVVLQAVVAKKVTKPPPPQRTRLCPHCCCCIKRIWSNFPALLQSMICLKMCKPKKKRRRGSSSVSVGKAP